MRFLYRIGLHAYHIAALLASPFYSKARKWAKGRRGWEAILRKVVTPGDKWIWFHAASLGEFEQGRNLIEGIKSRHSGYKVMLTFFSPSGYEIRKNYAYADCVMYLPQDYPRQAARFLDLLQPEWVFFIKYDLWLNYLREVRTRKIPAVLVSASVAPDSKFLTSPLAPLYKEAFLAFSAIFTQDQQTVSLLRDFCGHPGVVPSSDTRYDRVAANLSGFTPIEEIAAFVNNRFCLVGGSTWPKGEELLLEAFGKVSQGNPDVCMILAPHEIHQDRIRRWIDQYPDESIRFSDIQNRKPHHRILWIDNIGMLSRLYHYGAAAYIGGGWTGKLHNTLEAVAFGCPVVFGPKYAHRPEARELVASGGGHSVSHTDALVAWWQSWLQDPDHLAATRKKNQQFVQERVGATDQILKWCEENGLGK